MNFSDDVLIQNGWELLHGLQVTIEAGVVALVGSTILGGLIGLMRTAKLTIFSRAACVYIEVLQNIPYVTVIFFAYFGLPEVGIRLDAFWATTLGLIVYSSAFIAEAIRSGIQTVHPGQILASQSSGLSYAQMMRYVVMPQAVVFALPALTNQWVRVVKNTSVLALVAGEDLTYVASNIAASTFAIFQVFSTAAAVYVVLGLVITRGSGWLESRIAWRAPRTSTQTATVIENR